MILESIFSHPQIIGVIGNIHQGKSNLLYFLLDKLRKTKTFNLYTYGLRNEIEDSIKIHSVAELEQIKNSLVVLDEIDSLWDLSNRKLKSQIERTIRLIAHNNNILIICGCPSNYKKFISSKLDKIIYKKTNIYECINGSRVKTVLEGYKGYEKGTEVLNLDINEAVLFDGLHYHKLKIDYIKDKDTKRKNVNIFVPKKVIK